MQAPRANPQKMIHVKRARSWPPLVCVLGGLPSPRALEKEWSRSLARLTSALLELQQRRRHGAAGDVQGISPRASAHPKELWSPVGIPGLLSGCFVIPSACTSLCNPSWMAIGNSRDCRDLLLSRLGETSSKPHSPRKGARRAWWSLH